MGILHEMDESPAMIEDGIRRANDQRILEESSARLANRVRQAIDAKDYRLIVQLCRTDLRTSVLRRWRDPIALRAWAEKVRQDGSAADQAVADGCCVIADLPASEREAAIFPPG